MARVLLLFNQVDDDVYERWRAAGPRALAWDPARTAPDVGTVAEELEAIAAAARACGHEVTLVNVADDLRRLLRAVDVHRPDAVINLVEFFGDDPDHEAHVAGVLELLGVPYTGARPAALQLCQRKHRTKALLAAAGLPTAPYLVVTGAPGDDRAPPGHGLRFPLIVKPAMEDASGGIDHASVVRDPAALEARVAHVLREHAMPVLVEEFIDGRELHCAVLGEPLAALPLYELLFAPRAGADGQPLPRVVTFHAKWDPHSPDFYDVDGRCPPDDLEPEIVAAIQDVAVRAARLVGVRDYARVDLRLDPATGEPYVLEVNPNPDLAEHGAFAEAAHASGRTYPQLVGELVALALARRPAAGRARRRTGDQLLDEYLAAHGAAEPRR